MKIEISDDKSSATIDGVEYELKQKDKKISEWLKELPDGYRELALANFKDQEYKDIYSESIIHALEDAFIWRVSYEGYNFWWCVSGYLESKTSELPPLPKPKFEVWKPKEGDIVYSVGYYGYNETIFHSFCHKYKVFQTEAEAIEAHEKAMFNYEVEMFIKEKNEGWLPEFNFKYHKHFLVNDVHFRTLKVYSSNSYQHTSINKYFKSTEIGEEIIAKFDNEKLVKWWI